MYYHLHARRQRTETEATPSNLHRGSTRAPKFPPPPQTAGDSKRGPSAGNRVGWNPGSVDHRAVAHSLTRSTDSVHKRSGFFAHRRTTARCNESRGRSAVSNRVIHRRACKKAVTASNSGLAEQLHVQHRPDGSRLGFPLNSGYYPSRKLSLIP